MKLNDLIEAKVPKVDEEELAKKSVPAWKALYDHAVKKYGNDGGHYPEEAWYDPETQTFYVTWYVEQPRKKHDLIVGPDAKVVEKKFGPTELRKCHDLNNGDFIADVTERV